MNPQTQFKPINILRIANRLIDAGQDRRIAEEEAEIWQDVVAFNLVTKEDLEKTRGHLEKSIVTMKSDLEKSIVAMRSDLQKSIAETKAELIKWMIGLLVAFFFGNTAMMFTMPSYFK